jgi:tetratricopeptide (TPR) repeat protein
VASHILRRSLLSLGLIAVLAGWTSSTVLSAPPPQTSAASLIADYSDWIHGQRGDVDLRAVDLDAVRQELGRLDPASLPSPAGATPDIAREAQRRLLTSFALELAAVGSRRHAAAAARLVEWACAYVRSHTPVSEFDRAWEAAALSALEGGIDSQVLRTHLGHLHGGFDSDPRVLLAHGIAEEQFNAPSEVLTRSVAAANLAHAREELAHEEGERLRAADRAIARFKEAAASESVRSEALLRMGHVELRLGRYDAALAAWNGLETQTQDRGVLYLVHLFRGLALEGTGRASDARQSYLASLAVSPGAHSATLRLAALGFRRDRGDEPSRLVDALLQNDDPRRDPWWSYYAGDWRFWYPLIGHVRELLK